MTMSQKLIILAGLPGSGKSTLAEGLSRHFSLPLFSVDPIEAAMWRGGLSRDHTGIAAYVVAQALTEEHLKLGQSVVIDAVNPVEAPRAAWRTLAAKYRVDLTIIECVCVDEATHRRRIETRMRGIEGMREITWAEVEKRRSGYAAWSDPRLILDSSAHPPERLLAEAIAHLA